MVILKHHIGFGGDVSWRAHRSIYSGASNNFGILAPVRPIFYDINAVCARTFEKKFGADVMAGSGGEALRFYTPHVQCRAFSACTSCQSSNLFAIHYGVALL